MCTVKLLFCAQKKGPSSGSHTPDVMGSPTSRRERCCVKFRHRCIVKQHAKCAPVRTLSVHGCIVLVRTVIFIELECQYISRSFVFSFGSGYRNMIISKLRMHTSTKASKQIYTQAQHAHMYTHEHKHARAQAHKHSHKLTQTQT